MKRRILLLIALVSAMIFAFAVNAGAKSLYLEQIPDNLKTTNDTSEYFIVIEGEEYYKNNGSEVYGINTSLIQEQMGELAKTYSDVESGLGTKYLTKFIFPAQIGETTVTYFYLNNGEFKSSRYFKGVCGAIVIPATVTRLGDMNDAVAQLRSIEFEENSQLRKIPTCFARYATKLKEIKNFPTNLVDGIESQAFVNCNNAFTGELYLNASKIEFKAFDNALANVKGIVFGPLTANLGEQALSAGETGDVQIEYLEFECDIRNVTFCESTDTGFKGVFYFGLNSGSQRKPLSKLKCIILSNPAQASTPDGTSFQSFFSYNVFFNGNETNPVYTSHKIDEAKAQITYESILREGVKSASCERCTKAQSTAVAPIFTAKGYSTNDDDTGIAGGYFINKEALSEWKQYGDRSVTFGIMLLNPKYLAQGSFFKEDGTLNSTQGALNIEMASAEYSSFDFMISNFSSAQATLEIVIAGYVIVDGKYELLQAEYSFSETPAVSRVTREEASLYTVTIASVKQNNNLATLPEYIVPVKEEE